MTQKKLTFSRVGGALAMAMAILLSSAAAYTAFLFDFDSYIDELRVRHQQHPGHRYSQPGEAFMRTPRLTDGERAELVVLMDDVDLERREVEQVAFSRVLAAQPDVIRQELWSWATTYSDSVILALNRWRVDAYSDGWRNDWSLREGGILSSMDGPQRAAVERAWTHYGGAMLDDLDRTIDDLNDLQLQREIPFLVSCLAAARSYPTEPTGRLLHYADTGERAQRLRALRDGAPASGVVFRLVEEDGRVFLRVMRGDAELSRHFVWDTLRPTSIADLRLGALGEDLGHQLGLTQDSSRRVLQEAPPTLAETIFLR